MRFRAPLAVVLTAGMALASAGIATAHGGGEDGHVPANTNYGISPVGYSPLEGVQDGRYTDVWAHEGFAYVGSFQNPDCSNDGVYIADIRDPQQPEYIGQIHSAPGTRVNDVKVTDVGDRDILIFTYEVCGTDVALASASQMGRDRSEVITDDGLVGQGSDGISLYDVTKPKAPRKLVKGFLETEVHNTYPWTTDEGTFLLVVDDFNIDDTWIVDISNPDDPELLVKTGLGTWLAQGKFDINTTVPGHLRVPAAARRLGRAQPGRGPLGGSAVVLGRRLRQARRQRSGRSGVPRRLRLPRAGPDPGRGAGRLRRPARGQRPRGRVRR